MKSICSSHKKPKDIFSCQKSEYICERCALFDQAYKNDNFLEKSMVPIRSKQLVETFQKEFMSIGFIVIDNDIVYNQAIQHLCKQAYEDQYTTICASYDQIIAQINQQKLLTLKNVKLNIQIILNQNKNASIFQSLSKKYLQLNRQRQFIKILFKENLHETVCSKFFEQNLNKQVRQISHQLKNMMSLTKKKCQQISNFVFSQNVINRNNQKWQKISLIEENLLQNLTDDNSLIFELSNDSIDSSKDECSIKSLCQTEIIDDQQSKNKKEICIGGVIISL